MAFREKIAWLTLISLILVYGVYFAVLGPQIDFGAASLVEVLWRFGPVAVVHALIMIAGTIALTIASPSEAKAPRDERDQAIERRSFQVGYYVLLIGLVWVGLVMPFSEPVYKIFHAGLIVIVASEILRYGMIVLAYRRG